MKTIILGGGIAGLSLATFLKEDSIILEKSKAVGGLCRSYDFNGIAYDAGPHILFSKNKEVLDMHTGMIETNHIKRSNKVFHHGKFVKYPFENDLASLPAEERDYCLQEFLNNPYENYTAENMLQFFLKTFGEGITRLYLQPYNEKIWKFDPSTMDTQMVERIPKPPKEDVIKSAKGIETEGYKHQLYFHYPKQRGFQELVDAYHTKAKVKAEIMTGVEIEEIKKTGDEWTVKSNKRSMTTNRIINCMPIHELFRYIDAPKEIRQHVDGLKFNSLYITIVQAKKDKIGDNLALYIADKDILFHRITKLNFFGENYRLPNGASTLMVEVTYRPGSHLASLDQEAIKSRIIDGLDKLDLVDRNDIIDLTCRSLHYAYVIYDLDHRKNTDAILNHLEGIGIHSAGRFAEWEYLNSDAVVAHTLKLAGKLNG